VKPEVIGAKRTTNIPTIMTAEKISAGLP